MEKVDSGYEWMKNVSREIDTLIKCEKKMLEIKNTITDEECLWWAHHRVGTIQLRKE